MESKPELSRDEFITHMREKMEAMRGQAADAINGAPPGQIISGSEGQVRDLFADLRQQAFETGSQMRVEAAEAASPPSEGSNHRQDRAKSAAARSHRAHDQRSSPAPAAALAFPGRGVGYAAGLLAGRRGGDDQSGGAGGGLSAQRRRQEFRQGGRRSGTHRSDQIKPGGETLRVPVEAEGGRVPQARRSGRLALDWSAADGRADPKAETSPTRGYLGSDGVMVPSVAGAGKTPRRRKTLTARLKGSGMRWDATNAEALMALEALTQSGRWAGYGKSQMRPTG